MTTAWTRLNSRRPGTTRACGSSLGTPRMGMASSSHTGKRSASLSTGGSDSESGNQLPNYQVTRLPDSSADVRPMRPDLVIQVMQVPPDVFQGVRIMRVERGCELL